MRTPSLVLSELVAESFLEIVIYCRMFAGGASPDATTVRGHPALSFAVGKRQHIAFSGNEGPSSRSGQICGEVLSSMSRLRRLSGRSKNGRIAVSNT